MKKVILTGRGQIIGSVEDMEDSGELIEFCAILKDVCVTVDGVDITKEKGKYINSKSYIKDHYLLSESAPHFFRLLDEDEYYFESVFLIDDDNFDPKKLQLIKSDYELDFLPYGIMIDSIMYDGEVVEVEELLDDDENYDFWRNTEFSFTHYEIVQIDYELPYC